jgi:tryptophanyl-tRNA synthetase
LDSSKGRALAPHSAIVTKVNGAGQAVRLSSKWGENNLCSLDNLFCNENKSIVIKEYVNKIKFNNLKKILLENKNDPFEELKKKYNAYVKKLNSTDSNLSTVKSLSTLTTSIKSIP